MIEPLFGPNVSMWSGIPPQVFNPFAVPIGAAQRPAVTSTPGFSAPPYIGSLDAIGYSSVGAPGVIPALSGPDVDNGPTARSLVVLAAMRRGQPTGPTNDQEIEELIFDTLDMLIGAGEVEVRCEGGRVTLTGSVVHKRLKRDVGEVAWAIPGVSDVANSITIAGRRRSRARDVESVAAGKKSAA